MAARAGMTNLIARLRQMCEAGSADYILAGKTYWSDDDLQARLDEHRRRVIGTALIVRPTYEMGEYVYERYEIPREVGNTVEGVAGGADVFRVYDSTGAAVSADDYTFNERDLTVTFDADTEGAAYYWDGYVYDIRAAAKDIWLDKAAHAANAINFSADGHKFDREALYQHCMSQAKVYGYSEANAGGGMKTSRLIRTDLAGWWNADRD